MLDRCIPPPHEIYIQRRAARIMGLVFIDNGIDRCIKCENIVVLGRGTPPDRNIYLARTPTCKCVTKIRKRSMTNTEQWDEMTREDDMDPPVVEYADDDAS